jgi:hypothetical protein
MITIREVQKADLAGKTKKTLASIYANGETRVSFVDCLHDSQGRAILPLHMLNRMLDQRGVRRGDTYSVG